MLHVFFVNSILVSGYYKVKRKAYRKPGHILQACAFETKVLFRYYAVSLGANTLVCYYTGDIDAPRLPIKHLQQFRKLSRAP